ncbi:MAG: hypothetical protein Q8L87_18405 [Anaerolineales bacterium]|jgi:hypothetical protein|nr:hypothetical protein [Anaerolineales bacterium]
MTIYTSSEVQRQFSALLKKALREGQVKFKTKDGRIFIIRPEALPKSSPFEVRSVKLPITRADILEAIGENRARYS